MNDGIITLAYKKYNSHISFLKGVKTSVGVERDRQKRSETAKLTHNPFSFDLTTLCFPSRPHLEFLLLLSLLVLNRRFAVARSVVLYTHNDNTNISGNIIKHNLRTSINERTHFFVKIYISHFILERADISVVCERLVDTRTDCYINTTSSLDHSTLCYLQ